MDSKHNTEILTSPVVEYLTEDINSKKLELAKILDNQNLEKDVELPFILKDKIIMSPGVWNNYYYSREVVEDAFNATDWDEKERHHLFLDHDHDSTAAWVGKTENIRFDGMNVVGDLHIVDKPTAIKLAYGAHWGISPRVITETDEYVITSFKFDNNAIVVTPAVKTAWINNVEVSTMAEEEKTDVETTETTEETKTEDATETTEAVEEKKEESTEEAAKDAATDKEEEATEETTEAETETEKVEDMKDKLTLSAEDMALIKEFVTYIKDMKAKLTDTKESGDTKEMEAKINELSETVKKLTDTPVKQGKENEVELADISIEEADTRMLAHMRGD